MLYHLLPRLEDVHIVFNLFNYLTVRSAGAMASTLILMLLLGRRFIACMRARGIVNVPRNGLDRGQGPKVNMGGVLIVAVVAVSTLLWAELTNPYTIIALVVMLWMGSIGFLDDYLKVVRKTPRGLVERYKWAGSLGLGLALGASMPSARSRSMSIVVRWWRWRGRPAPARPPCSPLPEPSSRRPTARFVSVETT